MRTHFPTFALAVALLAGSMSFAQAANSGAMSAPTAGAGTAAPTAGASTAAPTAGASTAAPTVGTRPTSAPDAHEGMLPCRSGQTGNCAHE
jgi:hypothetical protein